MEPAKGLLFFEQPMGWGRGRGGYGLEQESYSAILLCSEWFIVLGEWMGSLGAAENVENLTVRHSIFLFFFNIDRPCKVAHKLRHQVWRIVRESGTN